MKKLIPLFFLTLFFLSCNSQEGLKSVSTQELKVLLEKENIQLLDVRTPKEVQLGFIETAKFANLFDADFPVKAANSLDKNKPVYVYCRSGRRSAKASEVLQEKGFTVINVLGGYNQWIKEK
ncbi:MULTISPECIES: rhodanese-like domain-containing protein [Polaribacter]|uniref:Rhodanese-like domain-containing protein n=1 Tax=Polaribacter butkevichii TaxID=218490 RepID=A0A2P6C6N4_9FLAO|nr:rhodanese-like domain-containing protein [Polaribacter butkevichii]PQJ68598.1 rhodanese-like domain-containing protein [Polaribacter butkevichii]